MSSKGGGRKIGNKARKPSFRRYWEERRRERHKRRNVEKFEKMVADSQARRALRRAGHSVTLPQPTNASRGRSAPPNPETPK